MITSDDSAAVTVYAGDMVAVARDFVDSWQTWNEQSNRCLGLNASTSTIERDSCEY